MNSNLAKTRPIENEVVDIMLPIIIPLFESDIKYLYVVKIFTIFLKKCLSFCFDFGKYMVEDKEAIIMAEKVFTIDIDSSECQYEDDVNKLCGLFYRHQGSGSSIPGSGTTGGTISGTVGLDEETKTAILNINKKLEEGICNCSGSGENDMFIEMVNELPTELEDGEQLTLVRNGEPLTNPKKGYIVIHDGREFIYGPISNDEMGWIELGDEKIDEWQN